MSENLTSKTIHGLKWSYITTVITAILQIGYTSVMARLLDPIAFGLVAMGGVAIRFTQYFAQMGMGQALVQKEKIDNFDIRATLTSSLIFSAGFFLLTYISAPFVIYVFDSPQVVSIIRFMALSFIFTGLSTTSISLLRRDLQFKALAIVSIISYVLAYGGVGIPAALLGYGVWSLVMASLANTFLMAFISYIFTKHSLRLTFEFKRYKLLLSFGSRISIVGFLEFLGANFSTVIIGNLLGAGKLGIYNRAENLVNLSMQSFSTSLSKVMFPSFSKLQSNIDRLKKAFISSLSILAFIIFPMCFAIAISAKQIVLIILGDKWVEAIPILQLLSVATAFNVLSHYGGILYDSTANLQVKMKLQFFYNIIIVLLILLLSKYGILGVAWAVFISVFLKSIAYFLLTVKILQIDFRSLLRTYFQIINVSIITAVSVQSVKMVCEHFEVSNYVTLIGEIFTGMIMLLILLFWRVNDNIKKSIFDILLNKTTIFNQTTWGKKHIKKGLTYLSGFRL